MSIPLVQEATKDAINTSIIAIKRNIERINMLLDLVDNDSPDLSGFATKQELQDAVTELQPVDEVTVGNMHSVTSNAVARVLSSDIKILESGVYAPVSISPSSWINYEVILSHTYDLTRGGNGLGFILSPVSYVDAAWLTVSGHWGALGTSAQDLTQSNKIAVYVTNIYNGGIQDGGFYWAVYGRESSIIS
jgi:hypothetical protein